MNSEIAVDPFVQEMIAGTNGNMYRSVIGKLDEYPISKLPIKPDGGGVLLDIGCGWGRWMVSAANAGFFPIGIDVKLDAALAAQRVMRSLKVEGFTVVADLEMLPFADESFDCVWSYSVLQHVNRPKARTCVQEVNRVLRNGSICMMEFPLAAGISNRFRIGRCVNDEDDPESWCVRYYSIEELRRLFNDVFGSFSYRSHCYFGIGIQSVDLRFVPFRYKPLVAASLILTLLSRIVPGLKRISDSIYVQGRKPSGPNGDSGPSRLDFLQFVNILRCPLSRSPLEFDWERGQLISREAGLAYSVEDGVPILLSHAACKL